MYSAVGAVPKTYTYDADDRLTSWTDGTLTTAYTYSPDRRIAGSSNAEETRVFAYSMKGELLSVTVTEAVEEGEPEPVVYSYAYDVLGRRVAKYVDAVLTEKYLWGGHNMALLAPNLFINRGSLRWSNPKA